MSYMLDLCFFCGWTRADMDVALAAGDELVSDPIVFVIHPEEFSVDAAIEFGVSINVRDEKGNNALWHALTAHSYDRARLLLNRGIDFAARNGEGKLPFAACALDAPVDIRKRMSYPVGVAIFTLPLPPDLCAALVHNNVYGVSPDVAARRKRGAGVRPQ